MNEDKEPDPLADLAALFATETGGSAEVRDTVPPAAPGPPPPLSPRSVVLPLHEQDGFGWPQFEAFCVELMELHPEVSSATLFGGSGSAQEGIDIVAELRRGGVLGVQCKQHKRFGAADVKKAVEATNYKADGFLILLSRKATGGARRAIARHDNWQLLDVADISRLVRTLAPEDARRLLETHFGPQWRQRFLGRTGPALFHSAEALSVRAKRWLPSFASRSWVRT